MASKTLGISTAPDTYVACVCAWCGDRLTGCLACSRQRETIRLLVQSTEAMGMLRGALLGPVKKRIPLGVVCDWLEERGYRQVADCLRRHKLHTACKWWRFIRALAEPTWNPFFPDQRTVQGD